MMMVVMVVVMMLEMLPRVNLSAKDLQQGYPAITVMVAGSVRGLASSSDRSIQVVEPRDSRGLGLLLTRWGMGCVKKRRKRRKRRKEGTF